ncbi:TolC family protein [Alishewanella sp. d11]|uniref:TolC family protein n=1 Tax=Alishewanella sp. d11 TaxID=3414030 RepID=UPI003BF87257
MPNALSCFILIFSISFAAYTVEAEPFPSDSISLAQSWQLLLQHDELLTANKFASQRSQALAETASSLSLPQIDFIGSYTHLDSNVVLDTLALNPLQDAAQTLPGQLLIDLIGGPDAFKTPITSQNIASTSLNMLWPVYSGGKIQARKQLLALNAQSSTFVTEELKRVKFQELVATYFGLVMAKRTLRTQQQIEQSLANHLKVAEGLERNAQISKVEHLAAAAAHDRAKVTTQALRQQVQIVNHKLNALLYRNLTQSGDNTADTLIETSTNLFTVKQLPSQQHFNNKISNHPKLQLLATRRAEAKQIAEVVKGLYRPEVFLYGRYNLTQTQSIASDIAPDWLVGLGMRIPLVDRSGKKGNISAATNNIDELEYLQRAANSELTLLLDLSYKEAQQALTEYHSLASTIALAELTVQLQQRAFAEGLGRSLDVIDAHTFLATTQTMRDAAALRFILSFSHLLTMTGDYEQIFNYAQHGEVIQ